MPDPTAPSSPSGPSVLVVDDEDAVARATAQALTRRGYRVTTAGGGIEALAKVRQDNFAAIISDLMMPDMDGRTLLRRVRDLDLDVPFVFLTGSPDIASAIDALEYGAFRYLLKPTSPKELADVVRTAVRWQELARVRREAAGELAGQPTGDRAGLEARFASALEHLWLATQPIVSCNAREVVAYETLLRTDEPSLRNPTDLIEAAERLTRTRDLGRRVRRLVAELVPSAPPSASIFVNVHPADLEDEELYAAAGALTPFAARIVLEITERAALDEIRGLRERVERLRSAGFRFAVDDLGAGYAGLSSFAAIEPEFVKADISLVRGIEGSLIKQKLMAAIAALARDLQVQLVAEGIETAAELACVTSLGAHAVQGYLFARPARGFPAIS